MPDPIKQLAKEIKEIKETQDYIIQKLEKCLKIYNSLAEFYKYIASNLK